MNQVVGMGLYSELFKSSIWEVFNQSLELIQENNRVQKIFGNDVTGHADPRSRRRRDRKPDYQLFTDKEQKKNMIMKYYIEGEKDSHGVVYVHCIENKAKDGWDYKLLTVEVPGQYFSSKITIKNDSNKLGASW
ncbi:hypothetical protein K502DRAFT_102419 [Neoconidiobolus thromboides FSU 785]|nr:hypothetical protein K502DRAFT_102419 [Neoconidiobolus thromboides FSU 785]